MKNILEDVQAWYAGECDGDWEHQHGIRINTLDNPGWAVRIDLAETSLADVPFRRIEADRSENDWVRCWVEGEVFNGCGGPGNLKEILDRFIAWHAAMGRRDA